MPFANRQIRFRQQVIQPLELIVDQRLQRADIQNPYRACGMLIQLCEHRQKGRLRFAGSRARGEQKVFLRIKNGVAGGHLDLPQLRPIARIDVILNIRRQPVK